MMTNLFTVFDPTTGMLSMNWLSMLMMVMFLPLNFWKLQSKMLILMNMINISIFKEMILHTKKTEPMTLLVSIFTFITINNMMGILPYVFTTTAHTSISLTLALSTWLAIMMYGWMNKTNKMFIHLVPIGTPMILMPFMVMIETISNMIRPGSLAVRLTANMIAGHLLMTLLGNNLVCNLPLLFVMMWMFMGLMMFEIAVAMIQSYVFLTLSTLYFSEI